MADTTALWAEHCQLQHHVDLMKLTDGPRPARKSGIGGMELLP